MKKNLAVIFFTIASLMMIIYVVDYKTVEAALLSIRIKYFVIAILFFILNYFFRALRLCHILKYQFNELPNLYGIITSYGAVNYLLPMRIGEFSLPLLLKRHYSLPLTSGFMTLLLIKVADLLFLIFGLITLIILDSNLFFDIIIKYHLLISALIGLMIISLFVYKHFVIKQWPKLIDVLQQLNTRLVIYTFLVWLMLLLQFYFLILSILPSASFTFILLLNIFGVIFALSPIQGLANIGVYEFSWFVAAGTIGEAVLYNISVAASTHILITVLVAIIFITAMGLRTLSSIRDLSSK